MSALPLAHAAQRLRRRPGRPRKSAEAYEASAPPANPLFMRAPEGAVPGLCPRLFDLEGTRTYLAVSVWTVRDLEAAGVLRRVRVPLPNGGELRKLLYDRQDLDALIEQWKTT